MPIIFFGQASIKAMIRDKVYFKYNQNITIRNALILPQHILQFLQDMLHPAAR